MKKLMVVLTLVLIMLAIAVPAALADQPRPGNNTAVTVYGSYNFGVVGVTGWGNNTSLYYAPTTKWNAAVIGVVGCKNNTSVSFGYGAQYNTVGVTVNNARSCWR